MLEKLARKLYDAANMGGLCSWSELDPDHPDRRDCLRAARAVALEVLRVVRERRTNIISSVSGMPIDVVRVVDVDQLTAELGEREG